MCVILTSYALFSRVWTLDLFVMSHLPYSLHVGRQTDLRLFKDLFVSRKAKKVLFSSLNSKNKDKYKFLKMFILISFRCDGKKSCRMNVNSNVFGDPCPGTHKYVEVHYACSPQFTTTTTRRPLPPWFLENGADNLWINPKTISNSNNNNYNNNNNNNEPATSRSSVETTETKPTSLTSPSTTLTTLTTSEQVTFFKFKALKWKLL